ncbi:MAG TPA: acyl-CoA dehydrogenase [Pyrinomonadaceae bacterium]|jgi:alkylation response protein AidB-like acyl-CoA dehydrogenase|nr:acyl-CoA dehydrogenase [Pyrinomonadaceae bacterium]
MDLNLTPSERQFRDEFRAWLKANLPAQWKGGGIASEDREDYIKYLRDWQRVLYEGGWAGISWPKAFGGRGATLIEQAIFQEELARANAPQLIGTIGLSLVGPTIIALGTDEQKARYLPRILSGEEIWCQGFSEPNAGSDLAALGTKAVRDGDDFRINGQKIWTSFAQLADWCLLLVRTDREAPRHKGITCLLLDMHSEGVTVRPLRQMSGDSGFNELFFSDVRVPVAQVLGEINKGWTTAITALMNERANLGTGVQVVFKRNLEALIARARVMERDGRPASLDPLVRQKLAQAYLELEILRLNTNRALTSLSKTGIPGPEGSTLKLYWSEMNQRTQQTAQEILGPYGQLKEFDHGLWEYAYLRARGNTIEAGTSEIQRNIIAERVLGLPKSY